MYVKYSNIKPLKKTEGAAGYDIASTMDFTLQPRTRHLFTTGIFLEIPAGYEGQVRSRSGLALRHGICVLNAPGTIDSDFRGEIQVLLYNASDIAYEVKVGDNIAQIVFAPCLNVDFLFGSSLSVTNRLHQGFGSTGK